MLLTGLVIYAVLSIMATIFIGYLCEEVNIITAIVLLFFSPVFVIGVAIHGAGHLLISVGEITLWRKKDARNK